MTLTKEEIEMIEREAWKVWENDQKTNPTPVNPHSFVYGYRIAATQLKEERERSAKLLDALRELAKWCNPDDRWNYMAALENAQKLINEYNNKP